MTHNDIPPVRTRSGDARRILVSQTVDPIALASGVRPQIVPLSRTLERFGATIVEEIAGPGFRTASEGDPDLVVVAEVTAEQEAALLDAKPANVQIERSQPLSFGFVRPGAPRQDPGLVPLGSGGFRTAIAVTGRGGAGVPGVEVFALGALWTHRGVTGADGVCELEVFGDAPEGIQALLLRPRKDHWSRYIAAPALVPDGVQQVSLRGIAESRDSGVDRGGWGLSALGVDRLPEGITGQGVRVVVIDSGLDHDHRDLSAITQGETVIDADPEGWRNDLIGHGSHVAGIIAAETNRRGIRSVAPGAEIIVMKLFPGGQTEHLGRALTRAIELGADIVNLSLGMAGDSPYLARVIAQARNAGIAVIAAAGNSAGPVMFPARMPEVLAVSAIGRDGTFPPDSYHDEQRVTGPSGLPDPSSAEGFFFAAFSCFGPEIDVAGPGVAVISSVPEDGYQAMDGTSMACPHITGLAALALASLPDFATGELSQRNAARVDGLFARMRGASRTIEGLGGAERIGAGLPDATALLGGP